MPINKEIMTVNPMEVANRATAFPPIIAGLPKV
jgi:hypothetical protein